MNLLFSITEKKEMLYQGKPYVKLKCSPMETPLNMGVSFPSQFTLVMTPQLFRKQFGHMGVGDRVHIALTSWKKPEEQHTVAKGEQDASHRQGQ
jgi:hypothetical protein